ncbi:MAG: hypothetical protein DI537_37900 [Stutzerimonas stutzeri]|nr:MAG: hypothetical protein DI537_37900 [Stutzerimonas stutzeri]
MAATEHYGLQKPDETRDVAAEFITLQLTLDQIDALIWALKQAVDGKAAADHPHTIAQVSGLSAALDNKMPANTTFSLDDLSDVDGAMMAAPGYMLVKRASGRWEPSSAAAALGAHQHQAQDISGLEDALDAIRNAISALQNGKQATLGFTPVNRSGDVMAGALEATELRSKGTVSAGAAVLGTNGDISGSGWQAWGSSSAFNAINARIEQRSLAWANDRVANLQYRKVSAGLFGRGAFTAPIGAVITGLGTGLGDGEFINGTYHYLQAYDPARGWVGFSG